MFSRSIKLTLLACLMLPVACVPRPHVVYASPPEPISIEVEVYDPVTGGVWEDVGVRIVEADQEWSGCLCVSPYPDSFELTDRTGIVVFTPYDVASYDVGFPLDRYGRAVLGEHPRGDEARVTLEVWAPGYRSVYFEVDVSWDRPYVAVAVPFQ